MESAEIQAKVQSMAPKPQQKRGRGVPAFYRGKEDEVREALQRMSIEEASKHYGKSPATISDAKRKLGIAGKRGRPAAQKVEAELVDVPVRKAVTSIPATKAPEATAQPISSRELEDLLAENRVLRGMVKELSLEVARLTTR